MDQPGVFDRLQAHRSAVVEAWFRTIAKTSFSPRPLAEVRARLDELTGVAIVALLTDPFPRALASSIGSEVADLHYQTPQALDGTLRVLGVELTAALPDADARALQPRLVELLAVVASSFYAACRAAILKEQDEIRAALFVTRQQAEAADEARAIAEASAEVRSELLGHVAHDLRSPLTSIKGQADLIAHRAGREVPPVEWLLARVTSIRTASEHMQDMIGELLDAARLQVGEQLDLDLSRADVADLVRTIVQHTQTTGRIIRYTPEGGPLVARIDRVRFGRVLENLLSNAIKYSPDPTPIEVRVAQAADQAIITVRDQGVGIPADELSQVTTPFYRASTARAIPGIGLGLAGVKAIVGQHGGQMRIESVLGEGTQITISLPVV